MCKVSGVSNRINPLDRGRRSNWIFCYRRYMHSAGV